MFAAKWQDIMETYFVSKKELNKWMQSNLRLVNFIITH